MSDTPAGSLDWVRPAAWVATAALTLLPLLAIKAADPRAWAFEDLPFALVMIAAVGLAFECALRVPARRAWRAGAALALATGVLLAWGNLAVGFAGSEDNEINMIFFAVPAAALAGSLVARFRAAGMATAMAIAAAVQVAAGLIAFFYGEFTGPLTVAFSGLWLASALLFLRSARECRAVQSA